MNPFSLLQHELETDKSDDDASACLRYLLPMWADDWADSPASYANAYDVIVAKLHTLAATQLRERMLRFCTELANSRKTAPYVSAY